MKFIRQTLIVGVVLFIAPAWMIVFNTGWIRHPEMWMLLAYLYFSCMLAAAAGLVAVMIMKGIINYGRK